MANRVATLMSFVWTAASSSATISRLCASARRCRPRRSKACCRQGCQAAYVETETGCDGVIPATRHRDRVAVDLKTPQEARRGRADDEAVTCFFRPVGQRL